MKVLILTRKESIDKYENKRFIESAFRQQVDLKFVSPEDFEIIVTKKGERSMLHKGQPVELPDCLIPRMGSGTTYFALAIIRQFEHLGVYVLNSSSSIEASKDKLASMQILTTNNMPIPRTMLAKFPLDLVIVNKVFNYPVVVKTTSGTHGKGVFLCENEEQLQDLMDLIEHSKNPHTNMILQEFVTTSKGKDIRIIIVGGRPIGAILRTAKKGSFKANFSTGGGVEEIKVKRSAEWLATEAANVLGLDVAGVDLLFDGDRYKVCEVNSAPEFNGFEKATSVDIPKCIFDYIKVRFSR